MFGLTVATGILTATILPALLVTLIGLIVINLIMKAVDAALAKSKLEKAAYSLIRSVARTALYALLVTIVASKLGIDLTSVIAIASVATLAVSLALQNVVSNVVGGLTLLSNKPFVAGDFAEIAGQAGTVLEVGMTYTKLQTPDNKVVSIPNSAILGAQIVNYSSGGMRRVDLPVCLSYDNDVDAVLEALKEVADMPCVLKDQEVFVGVTDYGQSTINYVVRFWVNSANYWDGFFGGNQRIPKVLKAHGLTVTYPHLNVHVENK